MAESEWTLNTLKTHFDALREADREAVAVALQAQKEQFQEYKTGRIDTRSTIIMIVGVVALAVSFFLNFRPV